ncbi:MAG: hypothetical protein JO352_08585 [Chloroflexi bacterium]|nr:hypothetical protein [Chloroflexota bacterium]MBV9603142.1 hypothetical protein [Chloroflexota bacterium]
MPRCSAPTGTVVAGASQAAAPLAWRADNPSLKIYDPDRQASPVPGLPLRQAEPRYALTAGPQTAGTTIIIHGRRLQLPADVWVDGYQVEVRCAPTGPCPDPPIDTLRRGQSWLRFAVQDGTVVDEHLEPGQEAAFDFLQPVLVRPP